MNNTSNHTITLKEYNIGQSHIKVTIPEIPTDDKIRDFLIGFYDLINDIARSAEKRGVDTSNWFYTDQQLQELKKDPRNKFL